MEHPGALEAIEAFLLRTKVRRLIDLHASRPELLPSRDVAIAVNPIIKTHSFELLRSAFAEAGFDAT